MQRARKYVRCWMPPIKFAHGNCSLTVSLLGVVTIGVSPVKFCLLVACFNMPASARSANTNGVLDDWGSADVQAAVATIPDWIKNVNWEGPGVALGDWILVGHSNGGIYPYDILECF